VDSREPEAVAESYLAAVDDVLPGLVERLYLVGSAAIGAWQPGVSDVDAIIYTSRPLTESDHALLPLTVDGPYLPPSRHGVFPTDRPVVPFVVGGELKTGVPCSELSPAVGLLLDKYGITVRGPAPEVRLDRAELRDYLLGNLRDFWQANVAGVPDHLATVAPDDPMDAYMLTFYALGPARLHYTLAHEDIISKAAAGDYLVSLFPSYAELVRRSQAWRRGEPSTFTMADLGTVAESVNAVVDDAWRRFSPDPDRPGPSSPGRPPRP
jgi:hypothetical protein